MTITSESVSLVFGFGTRQALISCSAPKGMSLIKKPIEQHIVDKYWPIFKIQQPGGSKGDNKRTMQCSQKSTPECDLPLADVLVGLVGHVTGQHNMQKDSWWRDLITTNLWRKRQCRCIKTYKCWSEIHKYKYKYTYNYKYKYNYPGSRQWPVPPCTDRSSAIQEGRTGGFLKIFLRKVANIDNI